MLFRKGFPLGDILAILMRNLIQVIREEAENEIRGNIKGLAVTTSAEQRTYPNNAITIAKRVSSNLYSIQISAATQVPNFKHDEVGPNLPKSGFAHTRWSINFCDPAPT